MTELYLGSEALLANSQLDAIPNDLTGVEAGPTRQTCALVLLRSLIVPLFETLPCGSDGKQQGTTGAPPTDAALAALQWVLL